MASGTITQNPIQRVQISFLNTITTTISHNRIKKVGDSCRADFEFALVSAFQGNKQIGTVPTGYENDAEYCTNVAWVSSSDNAVSVFIYVDKVYMQSNTGLSAGDVIRGSLTWFHK